MKMTGEFLISAPRQTVWDALNDAAILKDCLRGCESLERVSEDAFEMTITTKVGPVKTTLKGELDLSDVDPPNGYTISGRANGGPAGHAKGGANVRLTEREGVTVLTYDVSATLGGKLAQMGSRVINGVARKMADDFFGRFAGRLNESSGSAGVPPRAELNAATAKE